MRQNSPLRIFDADAHVMEPPGMWEHHIEARFKDRAPRLIRDEEGRTTLLTDGRRSPRPECLSLPMRAALTARGRASLAEARAAGFDAASQLRAMDAAGIETAFLYPTQGLYMASIGDLPGDFAIAICRAYNKWIAEFCAAAPERLLPAGMLAGLHDPRLATEEARRLAGEGFRGVFVRPNPIAGRNLDDAAYEPLWAVCAEGGMAVAVHEGFGSHLPSAGADRFRGFLACHTAAHPIEQMLAVLSLIGGGVLERHPLLRVAFLEAGCGWVPYWLWRMDEHWEQARGVPGEPQLPLRPSDYFRRQAWVSCDPGEPDLARVIDLVGADRVVFGSDYPHPDHVWPESVDGIRAAAVPDDVKRKILWDNPRALYGLI